MKKGLYSTAAIVLLLALIFPAPQRVRSAGAKAATISYTVYDSSDNLGSCPGAQCTLRAAITAANSPANASNYISINFSFYGPIHLGSPLPALTNSTGVTITGPSGFPGISIDGGNLYHIFTVESGASVILQWLTISYANSSSPGAALYNKGSVTMYGCTFSHNVHTGNANGGGAIYNYSGGFLNINRSTFSYNQAYSGGAIYSSGGLSSMLEVFESTFDHNSSTNSGGAIFLGSSGPSNPIVNSTFFANSGSDGASIENGAGYNMLVLNSTIMDSIVGNAGNGAVQNYIATGTLTLQNTIVADTTIYNTSTQDANCNGIISNGGNNIEDGNSCGWGSFLSRFGSMVNTDPLLNPLGNYGGPTKTLLPKPTSPAVDGITFHAPTNDCPPTDQRGMKRPADGNRDGSLVCDIGAVEVQQQVYLPLLTK